MNEYITVNAVEGLTLGARITLKPKRIRYNAFQYNY